MIAGKRSMRLKLGRVSGCIRHRFRRGFTDLNTKTEDVMEKFLLRKWQQNQEML